MRLAILSQIWGVCDPSGSGGLTRDGLYKSLALAAVAQEGRTVEERALMSYRDSGEGSRGGGGSPVSCTRSYTLNSYTLELPSNTAWNSIHVAASWDSPMKKCMGTFSVNIL